MRRRDVTTGGVIVSAEVCGDAAAFRPRQQQRQVDLAATVNDRLRRLDHHLEFKTSRCQAGVTFQTIEQRGKRRDLLRDRDLRQRHYEVLRQTAVRFVEQRRNENVERAKTACPQFFVEWFDTNADKRRQRAFVTALRYLNRGRSSVPVFFVIGPVSITVFEVDTEIFDWFAMELFADAVVDGVGEPRGAVLAARGFGSLFQVVDQLRRVVESFR